MVTSFLGIKFYCNRLDQVIPFLELVHGFFFILQSCFGLNITMYVDGMRQSQPEVSWKTRIEVGSYGR